MAERRTGRAAEKGMTLIEVVCAMAVTAMLLTIGLGALGRVLHQSATRSIVTTFRALVAEASTRAVMERSYVGVVFTTTDRGVFGRLYRDGDWDGITHADIRNNVDTPLGSAVRLKEPGATIGIPADLVRDPFGFRLRPGDGVRFGRGDILSFSPTATATPGSLYIEDKSGMEAWAFRVSGIGGRVRVFRWFAGSWSLVD